MIQRRGMAREKKTLFRFSSASCLRQDVKRADTRRNIIENYIAKCSSRGCGLLLVLGFLEHRRAVALLLRFFFRMSQWLSNGAMWCKERRKGFPAAQAVDRILSTCSGSRSISVIL
jgi:hypothetical protein